MNRERALHLMVRGERAMRVYSGAREAWGGFTAGKTASKRMAEAIGVMIGAEDPLSSNFRRAHEGKAGGTAVFAILSGCMGAVLLPALLPKRRR